MKEEIYSPEEAMSVEERERYYNKKVADVVKFAYENALAIKERMDRARVKPTQICTTRHLELVPYITRNDIIELQKANPPFGGLLAVPLKSIYRVQYSPGPMYIPIASPEACAGGSRKALYAAGFREGDMAILSLPTLLTAGMGSEAGMTLNRIIVIPAGAGNTEMQVNIIRDLGVKGYIGTPTFLMNLLQKAEELGYDFKREFKLKCAIVWGEPLLPEVRKTIEEGCGISLRDGIGVGVGLVFGCECGQKNGFHITEEQFIEIVDPDTGKQLLPGEVGAVVVTAFSNNAFPIIRYLTGDLSKLDSAPCPCGRTSPRLMGVMGRVGDSVKIRALYLTPEQVKRVATRFPLILKCQVVVSRVGYKDKMTFNLEMADETVDRDKFCAELQASFQDACRLRIDEVNFVPLGTIPEEHKIIVDERSWRVRR